MIGRTLGRYRILAKLGAGGMGEVYLAEDPRLGRKVALKLLPEQLSRDPDRVRRFEREARSLAALNHPNIATIYSVEEADGAPFLTMELIEGRTLDAVIPAEGLPLPALLELAVPLADAIAAAHEGGIIHRDLKPSNVLVTGDGQVKLVDFGLAKQQTLGEAGRTTAPTDGLTEEGKVLGTVPYMSPE